MKSECQAKRDCVLVRNAKSERLVEEARIRRVRRAYDGVRGNTARTDQADNQRVVQNRVESGDYTEIVASIDDDLNGQGRQ